MKKTLVVVLLILSVLTGCCKNTDFNNDGSDEMLVVRHSSEDDLIFELYKKDGNSCVKTAQTSVIDGGVRSFNEKTEKIMLCERYGKKYIFMQFHNSDSAFCDGYYRGFCSSIDFKRRGNNGSTSNRINDAA